MSNVHTKAGTKTVVTKSQTPTLKTGLTKGLKVKVMKKHDEETMSMVSQHIEQVRATLGSSLMSPPKSPFFKKAITYKDNEKIKKLLDRQDVE